MKRKLMVGGGGGAEGRGGNGDRIDKSYKIGDGKVR
jgi:hypothetical protein